MSKALINKVKLNGYVDVSALGADKTGVVDATSIIQTAANTYAGKHALYFPAGTYKVSDTLRVPSNSRWFGMGAATIIKMDSAVVKNKSVIVTGHLADHRSNIVLEMFTVDYNAARHTNALGTGLGSGAGNVVGSGDGADQSAIAICNSSNVLVRRVRALDPWKHCIDVCAPSYVDVTPGDLGEYDPEPSYNVWIDGCYATGGGDDNITTHHSHSIWITDCVSENPSGVRTNDNTNCFEIDDGSRHVYIDNCRAVGGVCGLQIKGHNAAPAPFDVHVTNFTAINNLLGVELRHTDFYGGDPEDDGFTLPVINEDGSVSGSFGVSPTARDVFLTNISVIAPRNTVPEYSSAYSDAEWDALVALGTEPTLKALYGVRIRSYDNVQITNLTVDDGSNDTTGDFLPYIDMDGVPIRVYGGARGVSFENLTVRGFPTSSIGHGTINTTTNTWSAPFDAGQVAAILATGSFDKGLFFDGLSIVDSPRTGLRVTANADNVSVDNYDITGDHADVSGSYGIRFTGSNKKRIGSGHVEGFRNTIVNSNSNHSSRKAMDTTGVPSPMYEMVWEEGLSNATVAGEGGKLSMKVKLVADPADVEVASFEYRKTNANDTQRISNVHLKTSVDGIAAPTDVMKWGADQSVTNYGAVYSNVRAIVTAAATTVLTDTDYVVITTGATTHTLTLPAATTGRTLLFKNRSTGTVTVNRAGADTIDDALTSTTIIAGAGRLMVANGTNWCQVANA